MYGYLALDIKAYGWLNPYFAKSTDENTDMGNYWKLSNTYLNQFQMEFSDVDSK